MEASAHVHRLGTAQEVADLAAYVSEMPRSGRATFGGGEHVRLLADLQVQDIVGIADYLSRQIVAP